MPLETEINRHRESYEDLVAEKRPRRFTNGKYEGSEFTKASMGTRSDDDDVLNRGKRVAPLIIGGIIGTLLGGGIGGGIGFDNLPISADPPTTTTTSGSRQT